MALLLAWTERSRDNRCPVICVSAFYVDGASSSIRGKRWRAGDLGQHGLDARCEVLDAAGRWLNDVAWATKPVSTPLVPESGIRLVDDKQSVLRQLFRVELDVPGILTYLAQASGAPDMRDGCQRAIEAVLLVQREDIRSPPTKPASADSTC